MRKVCGCAAKKFYENTHGCGIISFSTFASKKIHTYHNFLLVRDAMANHIRIPYTSEGNGYVAEGKNWVVRGANTW